MFNRHNNLPQNIERHREAGITKLVERPAEKPGAILTLVRVPRCGKGFFSQSKLPVQTLSQVSVPYSPRVESRVSTSVRTLQILKPGSHVIVWTHESTAHTDRNG